MFNLDESAQGSFRCLKGNNDTEGTVFLFFLYLSCINNMWEGFIFDGCVLEWANKSFRVCLCSIFGYFWLFEHHLLAAQFQVASLVF